MRYCKRQNYLTFVKYILRNHCHYLNTFVKTLCMKIEQSICFDLILRRSELRTLTGLHAGHFPLNYHIHEMGLAVSNQCWLCKEHVETAKHVLCVINMKRLEKVKFWQLLWRFEIESCHSRITLMGVRRREVPYDLCQTVCEWQSDPFQLSLVDVRSHSKPCTP